MEDARIGKFLQERLRERFPLWMVSGVPRFFFDLMIDGKTLLDPTGGLFHGPAGARTAADQLAIHFMYCRVEICSSGNCIRVRDESGVEIHRSPIDYT